MPTYLAVIPAKGTSRRIPGKNLKDFLGQPIIAYSIAIAKKVGLFTHICVSTEDGGVVEIAKRYGAEIVKRPFELAEKYHPDCGTHEVTRHATLAYLKGGVDIEQVCCIYPCAPLVLPKDIWQGYEAMQRPGAWWAYPTGPDGQDAGAWYWGWAQSYVDRLPMPMDGSSEHVWQVPIPAERCCDINTPEDWTRAEQLYTALQQEEAHGQ